MDTLDHAKLKLKRVFPVYSLNGTSYIQGVGTLTEVADPDGRFSQLFGLLDGTYSLSELTRVLGNSPTPLAPSEVRSAIVDLDAAGYLEDASAPVPSDELLLERMSRNLGFFEAFSTLSLSKYELQRRLQQCRIAILGIGGVGSHVLYDLVALGIEELTIVDDDCVELSNLNRQILYTEADLGRPKVEAALGRATALNSRVRLHPHRMRLSSPEDVHAVVRHSDVVVSAVDRPKMHVARWVNEGCVRAGVTLIAGGVDVTRSFYYTVIPGVTGCVECWRSQAAAADPISEAVSQEMEAIEAKFAPLERFGQDLAAFGPLVSMQSACIVAELVRIATGIAPPVAVDRLLEVRIEDWTQCEVEHWSRNPHCPLCGGAAVQR